MKKINLKGISEILSEKELKSVVGGSDGAGSNSCVPDSMGYGCSIGGSSCWTGNAWGRCVSVFGMYEITCECQSF